ncbi:MAG: HAD hydrolase-like protein [Patescibacteria group bacterium]
MTHLSEHLTGKKRVLLFDFDGTLFNTAKLKDLISEQLRKYTINTDLLWETEKNLRDERFHLIETMRVFCEKVGNSEIQSTIQDLFLNQNFPELVYPEVMENLKSLHEENILALFSEGDETYQQVKIYQSKVSTLFDFIYIYHKKLEYLDELVTFFSNKEVWYLDNQLSKLQQAQQKHPQIKTVWFNREHLNPNISYTPDYTVSTLNELSLG